jgi:Protein of unknown function (DUF1194)
MLNVGAALSLMLLSGFPVSAQADEPWRKKVDLELVLAVDASGSVSLELSRDQRQGFAAAFRDPDLQRALLSGPLGTVAVVYFEWAGSANQRLVVPWTLLSTTREIAAFADLLVDVELHASGGGTSISGAMQFSRYLLASNNYDGLREVVDIAANGKNTEGTPVEDALRGQSSMSSYCQPERLSKRDPMLGSFVQMTNHSTPISETMLSVVRGLS